MSESLSDLELRRFEIVQQIQHLGDFRAGSITNTSGRCGKPNCRCHRPGQSGHGPNPRLTYKVGGKTVTESLSDLAALRKAEREIAEFRKYQQLNQEFLEVSAHICRLRPNEREAQALDQAKKNERRYSPRSRTGNKQTAKHYPCRPPQDGPVRPGSN